MKTTEYFQFRRKQPDRIQITDEWITHVLMHAEHTETQNDGRIRHWARIGDANNRYLRVVTLEDGETVHNAFFDRDFKAYKT